MSTLILLIIKVTNHDLRDEIKYHIIREFDEQTPTFHYLHILRVELNKYGYY